MNEAHFDATGGDQPAPTPGLTGLDALRVVVQQKVHRAPVTIAVPERPGWKLRFDANITHERRVAWLESATDTTAGRLDDLRLALLALAEKHDAIIDPAGNEVTDDGVALTFRSADVQSMLGVSRPVDAVRAFFGVDPHAQDAANKLYEAAGYFDEVAVDPTPGSSSS